MVLLLRRKRSGASSLKSYHIQSRTGRCFSVIAILSAIYLLFAYMAIDNQNMLFVLAVVIAFTCVELQNAWASLHSGAVVLEWDGKTLKVLHRSALVVALDSARWVYREPSYAVIAGTVRFKRFNCGHVRSNGRELTVSRFYGSGVDDLPERIAGLGPRKHRLWRRIPFWRPAATPLP